MSARSAELAERKVFSRISSPVEIPDLLDVQVKAFRHSLQLDVPEKERELMGLHEVLTEAFPVADAHRNYVLEYRNYYFGTPKYTPEECLERGVTYAAPLKVRLVLHLTDEFDRTKYAQSIEQDVYFGNVPFMTERGTFVINGAERVVVSQLQRSPGVFFDEVIHTSGQKMFQARVIPFRGAWIDFTTDVKENLFVIIDRRRKFPVTILLRSIGYSSNADIFRAFGLLEAVELNPAGIHRLADTPLIADIIDEQTGEVLLEAGKILTEDELHALKKKGVKSVETVPFGKGSGAGLLWNTMKEDPTKNTEEAVRLMYQHIRAGEPPNLETAQKFIDRMFFSPKRYDLGMVGRFRINKQFNLNVPVSHTVLTPEDIIRILQHLIAMRRGTQGADDIDHLGNRRMKTVGEQLVNQFAIALSRMFRTIRERMNLREAESLTPQDLINSRIVTTVINAFFGSSQLSQFMDQTNPLAEITHKRRISSLGPGGMTRERAGFEVRDVHYTHYGRLCPIETPEGPNIGLISSLAIHARVNGLGFIEAPYRVVEKRGHSAYLTDTVKYLSAEDEDRATIAQPDTRFDKSGRMSEERVLSRLKGDFPIVRPDQVEFVDVSPSQILSVAAALIPFLEHDDANRALMGSNMQRQAVPLLRSEAAIVGTGMEKNVARDSRSCIFSPVDGVVENVDAGAILIRATQSSDDLSVAPAGNIVRVPLTKYSRTNQNTSLNHRPVVQEGRKVKTGELLADGSACSQGELSLGRNVLVAFMPWRGYNFEDAIVISERLVKDDMFTSVHITEVDLEVRDTKRGEEELTREIPNVSEEATRDLDEHGIIREGARVRPGSLLIGKVTPKGETDPTPEEKLLRAIFGEKAGDMKDASRRAEPGVDGVVVKTRLFERKSKITRAEEKQTIEQLQKDARAAKKSLKKNRDQRLMDLLMDETCAGLRDVSSGKTVIKASTSLTKKRLEGIDLERIDRETPWITSRTKWIRIQRVWHSFEREWRHIEESLEKDIYKIQVGDELQPGVAKLAKVHVASKRKIQVGDKMAGRHGNKGVVSVVVPEEDMPFLPDGTPVDIVLNPLGVPSRMNLGQLYETMLGWAGKILGIRYSTGPFNGATPEDVEAEMKKAGLPLSGKSVLIDGRTGEPFDYPVTTGYIYMVKLNHMVEDKMHARSTGPYSLVTQQPLGGKAQFGGQRFGEMEVWALEAYGASHTLHEILTVKSDDVDGRSRVYNSIVRGENFPSFGIPESFNVLVKELQGLGVDVQLH